MTTSPLRLPKICAVLATLDLEYVDKIFLDEIKDTTSNWMPDIEVISVDVSSDVDKDPHRVDLNIKYPFEMFCLLILISLTFSLFGFIIGIWANDFQRIQLIPSFVITPLTFLGGSFYSINMLPEIWQKISYFNPIVYLISAFRWSFYGEEEIDIYISISTIFIFLLVCLLTIHYIFKTGYRIKS